MKKLLYLLLLGSVSAKAFTQTCPTTADAGPDKCITAGNFTQIGPLTPNPTSTYAWSTATGLSSTTIPNPTANPTTTTTYTLTQTILLPQNLITNGNFEQGNTGFTSNYTLSPPATTGSYSIVTNPNTVNPSYCNMGDATTGAGNMLLADGSTVGATASIWSQNVPVARATNYVFQLSVANPSTGLTSPTFTVTINGTTVIAAQQLPNGARNTCRWTTFTAQWNSANATVAQISIALTSTSAAGNDIVLDNIQLMQVCRPVTDQMTVNVSNVNTLAIQSASYTEGSASPVTIPNLTGDNPICYGWEASIDITLTSNFAANNTWIVNDIPITQSGFYPGAGFFDVNDNSRELKHKGPQYFNSIKYQVSNNDNGCTFTTPAMIARPVEGYFKGTASHILGNHIDDIPNRTVNQLYDLRFNYGSPTTYTWSFPSAVTYVDADISTPEVFIVSVSPTYNPPVGPFDACPHIPAQVTIANNPQGCNATYNVYFGVPCGFRQATPPTAKDSGNAQLTTNPTIDLSDRTMLYPNPVREVLQFRLADDATTAIVQVYNSSGTLVRQFSTAKMAGGSYRVPVKGLPAGMYILSAQAGGQFIRKKFSVVR